MNSIGKVQLDPHLAVPYSSHPQIHHGGAFDCVVDLASHDDPGWLPDDWVSGWKVTASAVEQANV